MFRKSGKAAAAAKDAAESDRYAKAALDKAWNMYNTLKAEAAKDAAPRGNEAQAQNYGTVIRNEVVEQVEETINAAKCAKDSGGPMNYENAAKHAAISAKSTKDAREKYYSGNEAESPHDSKRSVNYAEAARDITLRVCYAQAARDAAWSSYYAEAARDENDNNKANASKDADLTAHYAEAARDADLTAHYAEAARDATVRACRAEAARDDPKLSLSMLKEAIEEIMKDELKMVQRFKVDVTLDRDTAHPKLVLSRDGKQVKHEDGINKLQDNKNRCSSYYVLAEQSFPSGKFYFEVDVKGKTEWDVGVVKKSVDRTRTLTANHLKGRWMIWLRNRKDSRAASHKVLLDHCGVEKVGVFVDYEGRLVSFYNVKTAALIYSFTGCNFKEDLCPCFSPWHNYGGENSAPLKIC